MNANQGGRTTVPPRSVADVLLRPWSILAGSAFLGFVVATSVMGRIPPRYVKALMGLVFLVLLLKLPLYGIVSVFLVAYLFPTFTFFGNTNAIFVILMLIIWGIKVRLGQEPAPPKSWLDWAAFAYIAAQIIALANVESSDLMTLNLFQIQFMAAATGLYFLISKVVRTEPQLRTVMVGMLIANIIASISAMWEFFFPNIELIPREFLGRGQIGWSYGQGGRLGGIFGFHGLLADWNAMMFVLTAFFLTRTRRRSLRIALFVLILAGLFQIFVTANRGGFLIWGLGLAYIMWLNRKAVSLRTLVITLPLLMITIVAIDAVTSEYGSRITLIARLARTQLERGIPDTRVEVWKKIWAEIPEHLWIGHGPYYDMRGGWGRLGRPEPHSAYLMYLFTTGVLGLSTWLYVMVKAFVKTTPRGITSMRRVSFARGVMAVVHIQILQFALSQIRNSHHRGNLEPYLMWAFFGLAVASHRIVQQQREQAARAQRGQDAEVVEA